MVGHGGRAEGREYFIGTEEGPEDVKDVFEDAKYFEGEDGEYRSTGMMVDITDEGINYDVTEEVKDEAVQEFVEGIVRSFNGGEDSDFRSDKTNQIRDNMADFDHGSPNDVQNTLERGPEEYDKIADGGYTGMPIGGGPNYVEKKTEEEKDSMGEHPM